MANKEITIKYILAIAVAVIFTWLVHGFAHWVVSELLGHKAVMTFNTVSPVNGENQNEWHKVFISAAGPIITLLQAIIVFILLNSSGWKKYLYPLLFTAFYMRLIAGLLNFINPNDEGRISLFLGIGTFTLSIIVSGFLFFLVYKISKKYELSWKFQLVTTLLVMFVSSILIMSDQFFRIRIL